MKCSRWKVKKNSQVICSSAFVSPPWRHQFHSPYPDPHLNLVLGCRLFPSHDAMLPDGNQPRRGCWNKSLSSVGGFRSEIRGLPFKPGNSLIQLLFPFIEDKWKAIYRPVALKILAPDFLHKSVCCFFAAVRLHNWYFSIQSNMCASAGRACVVLPVHHSSGENVQDFCLCPEVQHSSWAKNGCQSQEQTRKQ